MRKNAITMPASWAPAIVDLDYSGLDDIERRRMNNCLIAKGILFADCTDKSKPYQGKFENSVCEVIDYTFKIIRR